MATIKAIQASSIHQIQSGQVIVDLNSVVKELVENSLDAGASSIEVRFKNNGLDSIEVQDNGNGIAPENYEAIALKHHTSKLSSYEDLDRLDTFGFRGEALSSLCALSNFHIVTATADVGSKGSRLDFETSGKLKRMSIAAAQKGTTVAVEKLFKNLPVRRRELEKNIKREYAKVLALLQAYACISVNVRFSVTNQPTKGNKMTAFSTKSNSATKENIVNIYGTKTMQALTQLNLELEMSSATPSALRTRMTSGDGDEKSRQVLVQGFISRPVHGEGRQAPDKQMFYVNSRPCLLPQVSKAFNEVYKSFNMSQSPFVFANLILDTNAYDVNVSPDKRTILLHDQTLLLETLKERLTKLFDEHDQTVPAGQLQSKRLLSFKEPPLLSTTSSTGSDAGNAGSAGEAATPDATELSDQESHATTHLAHRSIDEQNESVEPSQIALDSLFVPLNDRTNQRQRSVSPVEEVSRVARPSVRDQAIEDFNARMQSQETRRLAGRVTTETVLLADDDNDDDDDNHTNDTARSDSEEIVSTRPKRAKAAPGPVQNAFDRMRPKRSYDEVATVTIGDQTTRMTLGTPEAKRVRIHTPGSSLQKSDASSMNMRSSLRAYAAPGSQYAQSKQGEAGEDSDKEEDYGPEEDGSRKADHDSPQSFDGDADESPPSLADTSAKETSPPTSPNLVFEAEESDDEYLDEEQKKLREDAKVARLILAAEENAARPTQDLIRRASQLLKSNPDRKAATLGLEQSIQISEADLFDLNGASVYAQLLASAADSKGRTRADDIGQADAEAKLSLTISKADFGNMRVAGQFNLGFILAVRRGSDPALAAEVTSSEEHLFIIDQHAADEKFNFERLSATTTLTPQALVTPKQLQLSAVEEELVLANRHSLIANGFTIEMQDGDAKDHDVALDDPASSMQTDAGSTATRAISHSLLPSDRTRRSFKLLTLPTSKETTFSVSDLEELLHLLSETSASNYESNDLDMDDSFIPTASTDAPNGTETRPSGHAHLSANGADAHNRTIVRPSRVRKMLAMRACRSSIMVGKTLTKGQMAKVVRHMGEMDRPWNCPHGRPTMRHLAGLGEWSSWDGDVGPAVDWAGYLAEEPSEGESVA